MKISFRIGLAELESQPVLLLLWFKSDRKYQYKYKDETKILLFSTSHLDIGVYLVFRLLWYREYSSAPHL